MRRSSMPYEQVIRHVARFVYSPGLANKPKAYEAFIQVMLANPFRQTDHGFFRQADALLAHSVPANLAELRMPATVLVGEYDQLTPRYLSEQLAAAIAGAALHVLPGAHSGFVERPDEWTNAIRGALDRVAKQ